MMTIKPSSGCMNSARNASMRTSFKSIPSSAARALRNSSESSKSRKMSEAVEYACDVLSLMKVTRTSVLSSVISVSGGSTVCDRTSGVRYSDVFHRDGIESPRDNSDLASPALRMRELKM